MGEFIAVVVFMLGLLACGILAVFVGVLAVVAFYLVSYIRLSRTWIEEQTKFCLLSTYMLHLDIKERENEDEGDSVLDADDDDDDTHSGDDDDTSEQWKYR